MQPTFHLEATENQESESPDYARISVRMTTHEQNAMA
jgi:hypothetical protein